VLSVSDVSLVQEPWRERRCEVERQHLRAPNELLAVSTRPSRWRVKVDPLIAVIHSGFVSGIEVMIELHVDLQAICVGVSASNQIERAGILRSPQPLVLCGIQAIPTLKRVGAGHDVQEFLGESHRVHSGPIRIPWGTLDSSVGTIGPLWRI